ncbi:MAG: MetQ/NlpA family ABC transporter substrate-binding protein [Christensenellales bacterium]|jgi:D-methionine transport system substrate-binding protein
MKHIRVALLLVLACALCLGVFGCKKEEPQTITLVVGASPAPHAQILEVVKPMLEAKGITLEIREFTDYVQPNTALQSGDLQANFFQHTPYMEDFNAQNNGTLVAAVAVHFEPLAIYAGRSQDITNPQDAVIAVPNDATNEARALLLLQANGLITLAEGVGLKATPKDIVENPFNISFYEAEAAAIPRSLEDVDFAVCNGNYAIEAGIEDKMIAKGEDFYRESADSEAASLYANVLAVREEEVKDPAIVELVRALTSQEVYDFITSHYGSSVIPVFIPGK